ncbi:hypothetical protein A3L04_02960 [Thermococcus chitonophagus]|uniref:ABC transporter domain-containing protein n=1 Tax=Thermococcus chitonophagus TaxID=54262 RepID=A0A2Z2NE65_9EURY|nr:hypothetical protein A3L04_02960 [Thermococcus chitonophagus]
MVSLEVIGLSFSYDEEVLKNISFEAHPGEITVILGPNGAGKSTLLRCIAGMLKCKGKVTFNGKPMDHEDRVKMIGYVPQEYSIRAPLTVLETVLLGRITQMSWRVKREDLVAAFNAMKKVGIENLAKRYIGELSGGQRQLVFIAQALAKEPRILLLDEPISNLDLKNKLKVLEMVRQITREENIVTILVLHELDFAIRYGDRVVVLNKGEVYCRGNPRKVITEEMILRVYGVRAKVIHGEIPHVLPLKSVDQESDERGLIIESPLRVP